MYRLKWLALGLLVFGVFAFSQQKYEQRIRSLEQKTIVIEDYLKNRLQQLEERLDKQQIQIQKLGQRSNHLEKKLAVAKKKLRAAESEIIKLQIEIKTVPKTEISSGKDKAPKENPRHTGTYTDPRVKKCVQDLDSTRSDVRMGAVLQLANIEHDETVFALVGALRDKDPYVQMLACKILARKKSVEAVAPLFSLLQSPNREVRRAAEKSLKKLTGTESDYDPEKSEEIRAKAIDIWRAKIDAK